MNERRRSSSKSSETSCYDIMLRNALPPRPHSLLMAACLCVPHTASQAWRDFVAAVGDPKRFFELNGTGLKGMLPLVESRLTELGIDAGRSFHTYARVASVREALRNRIYLEILCEALDALDRSGASCVLLKGGAVSASVYPQPSCRHNHAIDLWIEAPQMRCASAVLLSGRFAAEEAGPGDAWHRSFRHVTGLPLALHSKPLYLPHFELPLEEIVGRLRTVGLGASSARILSPEDCLVHVLGHSIYSRSRSNLRWVCDAFYLVERNPAIAWNVVVQTATCSRLALPLLVSLRWMKRNLGARIPETTLSELADGSPLNAAQVEGLYAAMLHTSASPRKAYRWAQANWRTALGFVRFIVLPSSRYMSWRYNAPLWKLPYYHLTRALNFGVSSLSRALTRWRNRAIANGRAEG